MRTRSTLGSDPTNPTAEATPAAQGTATDVMPNVSASRATCIGPAPPNPTNVNGRGSTPRCTVTTRMAAAMLAFTTSWIPRAASGTSVPSEDATARPMASSARATESVTPPASPAGSRYPSTRLAAVTVGSTPPRS